MKPGMTVWPLAVALMAAPACVVAQSQQQQPQQTVPDAPAPQPGTAAPLSGITSGMTPGIGTSATTGPDVQQTQQATPGSNTGGSFASQAQQSAGDAPPPTTAPTSQPVPSNEPPPDTPATGQGAGYVLHVPVNFVEVPVTVKDKDGHLVPGLTWRDFTIYESGELQHLRLFTVDPFPLSIAFVVDQSVTSDVMTKVNDSLKAIQGALTPYDEASVWTYNNGPQQRTGFTGAQSNRLTAVLEVAKSRGRDEGVPVNSGPLAGCAIVSNGHCVDPNVQPGFSAGGDGNWMSIPKEVHTLNDAILAAARDLSTREKGRRRVIYVISDGKEYGSKANYKEVIRYLQTNKIAVYATAVGDSARWGEGYLSRFHLPFQMYDNILTKYTAATGGSIDTESGVNGMEKSYAKIAEEARTQYTLGYLSHRPVLDTRFRVIDVRVDRPNLEVIAKQGYYPSGQDSK